MSIKNKIIGNLEAWLFKSVVEDEYDGIKICNFRSNEDGFIEIIKSSLELMHQIDLKRYNRVKREIDWIVNSNLPEKYGARYKRTSKSCLIGFENYSEDQRHVCAYYAGSIVHESMHGELHTKGLNSYKNRKIQIERICVSEENRFYKKVENMHPEYQGTLVREFDKNDWDNSWSTPKYKKFYHEIRRIFHDQ